MLLILYQLNVVVFTSSNYALNTSFLKIPKLLLAFCGSNHLTRKHYSHKWTFFSLSTHSPWKSIFPIHFVSFTVPSIDRADVSLIYCLTTDHPEPSILTQQLFHFFSGTYLGTHSTPRDAGWDGSHLRIQTGWTDNVTLSKSWLFNLAISRKLSKIGVQE